MHCLTCMWGMHTVRTTAPSRTQALPSPLDQFHRLRATSCLLTGSQHVVSVLCFQIMCSTQQTLASHRTQPWLLTRTTQRYTAHPGAENLETA